MGKNDDTVRDDLQCRLCLKVLPDYISLLFHVRRCVKGPWLD
jgi:hypothetical protein